MIAFTRSGEPHKAPVTDILLLLILHGAHHRGQMATYVSNSGTKPIITDFVQYLINRV
jgi:uncharacterized damage-inducible protein DinB